MNEHIASIEMRLEMLQVSLKTLGSVISEIQIKLDQVARKVNQ